MEAIPHSILMEAIHQIIQIVIIHHTMEANIILMEAINHIKAIHIKMVTIHIDLRMVN
jgi:hypothetical protein